jgi:hypothetical protein
LNNTSHEISKPKLAGQIMWLKEKLDKIVKHPYNQARAEFLLKLPANSLNIIVDQIHNIYKKHRPSLEKEAHL